MLKEIREMTYRGYTFGDYFDSELEDVEYTANGDGWNHCGIYYDDKELWNDERDNFKDWVDDQIEKYGEIK